MNRSSRGRAWHTMVSNNFIMSIHPNSRQRSLSARSTPPSLRTTPAKSSSSWDSYKTFITLRASGDHPQSLFSGAKREAQETHPRDQTLGTRRTVGKRELCMWVRIIRICEGAVGWPTNTLTRERSLRTWKSTRKGKIKKDRKEKNEQLCGWSSLPVREK